MEMESPMSSTRGRPGTSATGASEGSGLRAAGFGSAGAAAGASVLGAGFGASAARRGEREEGGAEESEREELRVHGRETRMTISAAGLASGKGAFPPAARPMRREFCAKRIQSGVERGSPLSLSERGCRLQFLACGLRERRSSVEGSSLFLGAARARDAQGNGGGTPVRRRLGESRALHLKRELAYVRTPEMIEGRLLRSGSAELGR